MQRIEKWRVAAAIMSAVLMVFYVNNTVYGNVAIRPPSVSTWNQGQIGNVVRDNNIHGLNAPGRPNSIGINDHHTNVWQRFTFNYNFVSGPDFGHVFGSSTQVSAGQVRQNPAWQNVRTDRNVAQAPLPYGVFSAIVATYNANPFFATWVNERGGLPFVLDNPNILAQFDTLGHGINAPWQSPGFSNMEQGGFLPPTSIGN